MIKTDCTIQFFFGRKAFDNMMSTMIKMKAKSAATKGAKPPKPGSEPAFSILETSIEYFMKRTTKMMLAILNGVMSLSIFIFFSY